MLYKSDYLEEQAVLQVTTKMCAAARTAPKAHGKDTLHTLVLTGEEKEKLAQKMEKVGKWVIKCPHGMGVTRQMSVLLRRLSLLAQIKSSEAFRIVDIVDL